MEESPVESLNGLFEFFGSKALTPGALLDRINALIETSAQELSILHPSDKLIGHSYFIKLCRDLCQYPPALASDRPVKLFYELMNMFQSALTPSLLSILNHDEAALAKFYKKLCGGIVLNGQTNTDVLHQEIIHALFFSSNNTIVVDFQKYKQKMTENGKRVARN